MSAVMEHQDTIRPPQPLARSGVVEVSQSRAVAEVQASMMLARCFPRDELAARDKIINAFSREGLAVVAKYSYARGGTDIEGASIRSLEAIARLWGNVRCGVEEMSRSAGSSECRAYAMDMESGFYDEKTFVVRHVRDTKRGPQPLNDERDLYELIANMGARRKRACLETVIPDDVVADAMAQADVTLKTSFTITPEFLATLQGAFDKYGVTKQMIEVRIQRHIDAMTPAQAVSLKKIHTSLRDGMSIASDWFEMGEAAAPESKATTGTEKVKEKLVARRGKAPAADEAPPIDEAVALRKVDQAANVEAANEVVDLCRGLPFFESIVAARDARFPK